MRAQAGTRRPAAGGGACGTGCCGRFGREPPAAGRGDLDGLRAVADAGDGYAARELARLLHEDGDLDGLRARADAGDQYAASQLAGLLAGRGDLDGLRARIDADDEDAAWRLVELLIE